ncbi:unnamed protein product [Cylindrotheca closterium]|uniref:P-loop containing nucleoside triphosphate hydrolase protein n=1 Tax=Cylindrotheca closterium TaxID=2856 RepID=A0AAD2PXW7_9STRA|nr:unnamed protein product [Cylindrotheca closterium]
MSSSSKLEEGEAQQKGIQVICAGLGRTGTMSLTEALNKLGYKTYHYLHFSHQYAWAELADGKRTPQDIIQLIAKDGYTATLENPTCDIYQDILAEYPNAKVILTVRDTPEKFCKSWKTLFDTMVLTEKKFTWKYPSFFGYIPLFANLKKIRFFMGTTHLGLKPGELTHGWREKGDEWLAEQYIRHNEHVKANAKPENLLIFNVKEGWGPLCKFLGKEAPPDDEPFPNVQVNTTESLLELRRSFRTVTYMWIPMILGLGATAFFAVTLGRSFFTGGSKSATSTSTSTSTRAPSSPSQASSNAELLKAVSAAVPSSLFPRARSSQGSL